MKGGGKKKFFVQPPPPAIFFFFFCAKLFSVGGAVSWSWPKKYCAAQKRHCFGTNGGGRSVLEQNRKKSILLFVRAISISSSLPPLLPNQLKPPPLHFSLPPPPRAGICNLLISQVDFRTPGWRGGGNKCCGTEIREMYRGEEEEEVMKNLGEPSIFPVKRHAPLHFPLFLNGSET